MDENKEAEVVEVAPEAPVEATPEAPVATPEVIEAEPVEPEAA